LFDVSEVWEGQSRENIIKALKDGNKELQGNKIYDGIYNIYLKTGCFYKKPHNLVAAKARLAYYGNISLNRGGGFQIPTYMSGLGSYGDYISNSPNNDISKVLELFHIPNMSLEEYLKRYTQSSDKDWVNAEFENEKFLNTKNVKSGYWKNQTDKTDKDGNISLMRIENVDSKEYCLYKYDNNKYKKMPLSKFETEDKRYFRFANSVLKAKGCLPPIKAELSNELAYIKLGYLLPYEEENFFKLYSWPVSLKTVDFNRAMSGKVYLIFKAMAENMGIEVVETKK
jgi:hypothetical protein